jgi:hypothetical protein
MKRFFVLLFRAAPRGTVRSAFPWRALVRR